MKVLAALIPAIAFAGAAAPALATTAPGFTPPPPSPPRLAAMAIISPPTYTPAADGGSDNAAFSQDNRDVRLVAYDSAATNLVPGDTNQRRDVFVLYKNRGAANVAGRLIRASVGAHGAQGNGDSTHPSLDGTTGDVPHCVAFQSSATNLAPGAAEHAGSIYLRDLRAHRTSLVSIGSRSASDPSVDGHCTSVSYSAGGWILLRDLLSRGVLRIGRGENPDQQTDGGGVAYDSGGQVYLQRVVRHRGRLALSGRRILISDTRAGRPGNGVSTNPAVDDHGAHVAFESTATNLCAHRCPGYEINVEARADPNGPLSDIFERTLKQPRTAGVVESSMLLVSYGPWGWANGESHDPAISRDGKAVVFDSTAGNLDSAMLGSASENVFRWYWPSTRDFGTTQQISGVAEWLLHNSIFNGPSLHPSVSSRANYIAFTSYAAGPDGERNGPTIPDVFVRFAGLNHQGLPTH